MQNKLSQTAIIIILLLLLLILIRGIICIPAALFCDSPLSPPKFEYVFDIGGEPGFITIQDRDGFLWFSSFYNGMLRFDGSGKRMIREGSEGLSNDFVTQLFEDEDGSIWVGTRNSGVNSFDLQTGDFTRYIHDPDDPASIPQVSISDASAVGLVIFDPKSIRFSLYRHNPVVENSSGDFFVSTAAGIVLFDPEKGEVIEQITDDTWFYTIIEDHEDPDVIWGGGLEKFDKRTSSFTPHYHDSEDAESISSNTVYDVLEDSMGNFWVITDRGKTRDGQLWFWGFNGLNRFNPETLADNPNPPQIFLTSIKQGGEEIASSTAFEHLQKIELGWQDNFFEFEYVSLNYTSSIKNQYRYKLEGYDKE